MLKFPYLFVVIALFFVIEQINFSNSIDDDIKKHYDSDYQWSVITIDKNNNSDYGNLQNVVVVKKREEPKKDKLIHILLWLWTPISTYPLSYFSFGREDFIKTKCPVTNCYITNSTDFFGDDITKFDALVFNGRNFRNYDKSELPEQRSSHQKYIFRNMESSDNDPVCNPIFDNFFNWTATYKLSSDVVFPYFLIRDKTGQERGPRIDMTWTDQMSGVDNTFRSMLQKKSKAVAWFVSHCWTRSRREVYAEALKESLENHNLTLDTFGKCGTLQCPRSEQSKCQDIVEKTYYFYLSFENSISEDYITEKALIPLIYGAVPILYGGANYSRFLPPDSYIDARKYTADELAGIIAHLIATPEEYEQMFSWRNHYSYSEVDHMCRLCEALNYQAKASSRKVYGNFRSWWNPDHKERCKNDQWG